MPTEKNRLYIANLNQALRALNGISKELSAELRDASTRIVDQVLPAARSKASGRLAQKVAASIKPKRDRIPAITAGGRTPITLSGRSVPAGDVFFGSEFGSNASPQFGKPHLGRTGYFLYPAVRDLSGFITDEYLDALDDVLTKAARKGSG